MPARLFRRNPGFTLVAVLSLALGIGANTAIFQVIDAIRLRTLPVANPGELAEMRLIDHRRRAWQLRELAPVVDRADLASRFASARSAFSGVFATGAEFVQPRGRRRSAAGARALGQRRVFPRLGVQPAAGRLLSEADDRRGCAPRVVLSYPFWQRAYGGDRSDRRTHAHDRGATRGDHRRRAGGIFRPRGWTFVRRRAADLLRSASSAGGPGRLDSGTDWWLIVMGRMKPGWSVASATANLNTLSPPLFKTTLPANYPTVSVQRYLDFKLAAYEAGAGDFAGPRAVRVAALVPPRHRRACPADRLREPREPAPCPGQRTPARVRRPPRPRRIAWPHHPAIAHGKPPPCLRRCGGGRAPRDHAKRHAPRRSSRLRTRPSCSSWRWTGGSLDLRRCSPC